MQPIVRLIALVSLIFLSYACSDQGGTSPKALAVVNGKEITQSEFDLRWSQLPEYARKKYAEPEGRKQFLNELIDREVLLQEGKKRGLDRDRTLLERVERFRERSMLDILMREEVDARISVSTEAVKAYYDAHPGNFAAPEQLHASHILVKTEAEAAGLKKKLLRGEDFATLAKRISLDVSTKYKGGDLGNIRKGQMVPDFEKALFALKVGEISDPVLTPFGYHLIKLVDRAPGPPLSFDEVKDQVKEHMLLEKKQQRFQELVASLRANAKLRVTDLPVQATAPSIPPVDHVQ